MFNFFLSNLQILIKYYHNYFIREDVDDYDYSHIVDELLKTDKSKRKNIEETNNEYENVKEVISMFFKELSSFMFIYTFN